MQTLPLSLWVDRLFPIDQRLKKNRVSEQVHKKCMSKKLQRHTKERKVLTLEIVLIPKEKETTRVINLKNKLMLA